MSEGVVLERQLQPKQYSSTSTVRYDTCTSTSTVRFTVNACPGTSTADG